MAVKVESIKGRLRLRWSYEGNRYFLPGWKDNDLGKALAKSRASLIDTDMAMGNFDPTLARYRSAAKAQKSTEISAVVLFEQFMAHKRRGDITDRTAVKYRSLAGKVVAYFGERPATIDEDSADEFRLALATTLAPDTQRSYLFLMQAAWDWGIKRELIASNPWGDVLSRIKVSEKQPPRPFSKAEIAAILTGFRNSRYFSVYADLVTFLFGAGCRTGEAIALRWGNLSDDCAKVWILASKTNQARTFRLTPQLQTMLLNRRPEGWEPDDLVFPAVKGGAIDGRNFRNRAWVTVLRDAGVDYRVPYTTRHTFISHALRLGHDEDVARMAGHKVETMRKHYAADVSGGLKLPDIFA
jgi:integrase